MTQENKDLLLQDLCARLLYGVKVKTPYNDAILKGIVDRKGVKTTIDYTDIVTDKQTYPIRYIKPYLRPMSSMTDEQKKEYYNLCFEEEREEREYGEWITRVYYHNTIESIDWLNKNHFDYRNLIDKNLAINCTNLNIY